MNIYRLRVRGERLICSVEPSTIVQILFNIMLNRFEELKERVPVP